MGDTVERKVRTRTSAKRMAEIIPEMRELYATGKKSAPEIADEYGVTSKTVRNQLTPEDCDARWAALGLPGKYRTPTSAKRLAEIIPEMRELYATGKKSAREIADKYGVCQTTVLNHLGPKDRDARWAALVAGGQVGVRTTAKRLAKIIREIRALYVRATHSVEEIANIYSVHTVTVYRHLTPEDLDARRAAHRAKGKTGHLPKPSLKRMAEITPEIRELYVTGEKSPLQLALMYGLSLTAIYGCFTDGDQDAHRAAHRAKGKSGRMPRMSLKRLAESTLEMRELYATGEKSDHEIADMYGIGRSAIYRYFTDEDVDARRAEFIASGKSGRLPRMSRKRMAEIIPEMRELYATGEKSVREIVDMYRVAVSTIRGCFTVEDKDRRREARSA